MHWSMHPWMHGCMDPWMHGSMYPWIHASLDAWSHASMDCSSLAFRDWMRLITLRKSILNYLRNETKTILYPPFTHAQKRELTTLDMILFIDTSIPPSRRPPADTAVHDAGVLTAASLVSRRYPSPGHDVHSRTHAHLPCLQTRHSWTLHATASTSSPRHNSSGYCEHPYYIQVLASDHHSGNHENFSRFVFAIRLQSYLIVETNNTGYDWTCKSLWSFLICATCNSYGYKSSTFLGGVKPMGCANNLPVGVRYSRLLSWLSDSAWIMDWILADFIRFWSVQAEQLHLIAYTSMTMQVLQQQRIENHWGYVRLPHAFTLCSSHILWGVRDPFSSLRTDTISQEIR